MGWFERMEMVNDGEVRFKWFIYHQQCFIRWTINLLIDDDEACIRKKASAVIFRMINKYNIA
jgi:hypothetical protein